MNYAYYNENDKYAAEWLRQLIIAKLIPDGVVDDRSIADVRPADLADFTQCHFFAGIGGWAYALQLAEWPIERRVWTGSCPCQPFSQAGQKAGFSDIRHLWPTWDNLIEQCRPPEIFGEQVASKAALQWLDAVFIDLERKDYACGAADMCAAGVKAAHLRQRLVWVADSRGQDVPRFEQQERSVCGVTESRQLQYGHTGLYEGFQIRPDTTPFGWTDGLPRPVGAVRGFGNAIVPQVTAEFIKAYLEIT